MTSDPRPGPWTRSPTWGSGPGSPSAWASGDSELALERFRFAFTIR
jgi:hypothetical protein